NPASAASPDSRAKCRPDGMVPGPTGGERRTGSGQPRRLQAVSWAGESHAGAGDVPVVRPTKTGHGAGAMRRWLTTDRIAAVVADMGMGFSPERVSVQRRRGLTHQVSRRIPTLRGRGKDDGREGQQLKSSSDPACASTPGR